MQFDIGVNTIVLLVGPSQSGKSTWSKLFKEKITQIDSDLRVNIISSDQLRRELLGAELDRYHPHMMEASEAAFDLLFSKLQAFTQYPINNEFIVIDTTGLDTEFRKRIQEHAKKVCYRTAIVSFDYSHSEYFKGLTTFEEKNIVGKHVDVFKKNVLPNIKRKSYDFSLTVKDKTMSSWESMKINIVDYDMWSKCHFTDKNFNTDKDIMIIGDVHEHIIPVKSLIEKHPDKHIFFVGDIIDKGDNTKEAIESTVDLMKAGAILVRGNHESFVARRLLGEISPLDNEYDLFPSLKDISADEDLKEKFMFMYNQSIPFACIKTHGKRIYITHAPCYNKYIGKLDSNSQKMQRNFYFSSREKNAMVDDLSFMKNEEKYSHPLHVFGHVAHAMTVEQKNKIWLDTGSVYGNKLTALIVDKKGNKKIVHEKTEKVFDGELFNMKKDILLNVDIKTEEKINHQNENVGTVEKVKVEDLMDKYNLSPDARYWLNNFKNSNAEFVSGTMSPSKASDDKLEPIETAIDYYYGKGVDKVIIEPKFMGSRLQVYLFRDASKDFAITRSGHKIGHAEAMNKVFQELHQKFDQKDFWVDRIIFDGELMPWSLIAQELIEKEFLQYGESIKNEVDLLSNDEIFKGFNLDINLDKKQEMISTFLEQAHWFGKKDTVTYKAFSILKVDDELWIDKNQEDIFTMLNDEPYIVLDTSKESYEKANLFFNQLTQKINDSNLGNEGVVIKPLIWKSGVAPYMKVRNEKYLHLIYGYDYKLHYSEMIK